MKKVYFSIAVAAVSISLCAQVQIDKPIELTGGAGERAMTNLEAPINDTDAVNKAYVDAEVVANQQWSATNLQRP